MLEKYVKVAHLLRVLQQKAIYTYLVRIQNFRFHFPFDEIYRRLAFFHSRAFCFGVNKLHIKMKPSYTTTSGKATGITAGICTFPRLPCPCTKRHVMLNLTSTGVVSQHCMCVTCFFDKHGGRCCTEPSEN